MTRINAGVDPKELHRRHLIAEYREITMVPAALRRSFRTKNGYDIIEKIPREFTLNKGHVTFFYDKQMYLWKRFKALVVEMQSRGYNTDPAREIAFMNLPQAFYGDWRATDKARQIVLERIAFRVAEKPKLYENYVVPHK